MGEVDTGLKRNSFVGLSNLKTASEDVTSHFSSLAVVTKTFIPEDASQTEISLHKYLDSMRAFTVNAKMMLEEEEKDEMVASPKLKLAF